MCAIGAGRRAWGTGRQNQCALETPAASPSHTQHNWPARARESYEWNGEKGRLAAERHAAAKRAHLPSVGHRVRKTNGCVPKSGAIAWCVVRGVWC